MRSRYQTAFRSGTNLNSERPFRSDRIAGSSWLHAVGAIKGRNHERRTIGRQVTLATLVFVDPDVLHARARQLRATQISRQRQGFRGFGEASRGPGQVYDGQLGDETARRARRQPFQARLASFPASHRRRRPPQADLAAPTWQQSLLAPKPMLPKPAGFTCEGSADNIRASGLHSPRKKAEDMTAPTNRAVPKNNP